MSGANPAHMGRRGAVYFVRFRVPTDLTSRLGMVEFRRSLNTSDHQMARSRCLTATVWFRRIMDQLREMPALSRADLERAATEHFRELTVEVDQPRGFDPEHLDREVDFNVDASRTRTLDLDDQLKSNEFDGLVRRAAGRLAQRLGTTFDQLDGRERLFALQLAARAEREQMQLLIHMLTQPARRYKHVDDLFEERAAPTSGRRVAANAAAHSGGAAADSRRTHLDLP